VTVTHYLGIGTELRFTLRRWDLGGVLTVIEYGMLSM